MAIVGSYIFRGFELPDAYAKVITVHGGKNGWSGLLGVYASEEIAETGGQPVESVQVAAPYVDNQDALASIYNAAIALPAFAGMSSDEVGRRLTRLEFLQRFTLQERVIIRTAARSNVPIDDYIAMVEVATFVDLMRPDTIAGVQALEAAGLIGAGRAAQILNVG